MEEPKIVYAYILQKNNADIPKWTPEKVIKLINFYKQNELLWLKKDNNYHNLHLRRQIKTKLALELGTTYDAVHRKWNMVRQRYHQEVWKEKFTVNYVSQWYATEPMRFLDKNYDGNPPLGSDALRVTRPNIRLLNPKKRTPNPNSIRLPNLIKKTVKPKKEISKPNKRKKKREPKKEVVFKPLHTVEEINFNYLWTVDQTMKLINYYKEHRSLWDLGECEPKYQKEQLLELAAELKTSTMVVKLKWQKLKLAYFREVQKMEGTDYVSKWFAFKPLQFLDEQVVGGIFSDDIYKVVDDGMSLDDDLKMVEDDNYQEELKVLNGFVDGPKWHSPSPSTSSLYSVGQQ